MEDEITELKHRIRRLEKIIKYANLHWESCDECYEILNTTKKCEGCDKFICSKCDMMYKDFSFCTIECINKNSRIYWSLYRESPLSIAVAKGRTDLVEAILESGIDFYEPDCYRTPLMIAVEKRHKDIVKCFIKCKINLNEQSSDGSTALHLVEDCEIAKLLLDAGCDLQLVNAKGQTAKEYIQSKRLYHIVHVIESYESDPISFVKEPTED